MAGNPQETAAADAAELHTQGERVTPQRQLVLETLRATGEHLSADEVFARVSTHSPYINRATIYRALTWLKEHGFVSVTDLGLGQAQYQYLTPTRHHHLICLHCGTQQEFPDDLVTPLAASLRDRYGFAARLDHLAIFGRCAACQGSVDAH